MKKEIMTNKRIKKSLSVIDLSDPKNGPHVINLAIEKIQNCLSKKSDWPIPEIKRSSPITTIDKNYDRLLFPVDNPGRSSRYTRYISDNQVLRTHTSEMIPDILDELNKTETIDHLVMCPGICYRRDVIDKTHCGEPHQMDIWRTKKGLPRLERPELLELIKTIMECVLLGMKYRANEVTHPYTINGLEIEVLKNNGEWLELLECGETHPEILKNSGLDPQKYSGLAIGIGLDRLSMLIKDIEDIRILRSNDHRIKKQMERLDLYIPVSKYPLIRQDLSVSVSSDITEEDVCEIVKDSLNEKSDIIEEINIISETPYKKLPPEAIERLGITSEQKNLLIRVILRAHDRSLTHEEANEMRDVMYYAIDESKTGGYLAKN